MKQLGAMVLLLFVATGTVAWQVIQPTSPSAPISPGVSAPVNPGAAQTAQQIGDINFAQEQKDLDLQLRPDLSVSTWVLVVSNKKDATSVVQFYMDIENPQGFSSCSAPVTIGSGNASLKAGERRGVPITIASCSAGGGQGRLVIAGSTGQKNTLKVVLGSRKSPSLAWAAAVSLVLATLVCFICGLIAFLNGHKPSDLMGTLSWDFSSSWASNVTVFGSAFIFVLQATGFPDKPRFATRTEYLFVTAFAAALVALAPAVYRFISVGKVGASNSGPTVSSQGSVAGFLVACLFTTWGALLQTALELLVVREFAGTAILYSPIGVMVGVSIALTGAALVAYSSTTMLSSIAANATRTAPPRAHLTSFATAAVTPAQATGRRLAAL